jgi:hypothetical protein
MKKYAIHNVNSGHCFGEYEAENPDYALDAMSREAGYENYAAACEVAPAENNEIVVTELN